MAAKYRIFVRDASLARVGEIKDFTKLELVLRFNNVGTWKLDLPTLSEEAIALAQPGAGIIVTRNGVTVLSGPVTYRDRSWSKDGNKISVSGVDDLIWLFRRLVLPAASPYTASAYDVRTGIAETIIKQYVSVNVGAGAVTERRVPGFLIEVDQARGSSVTGRGRFQTVYELVNQLAFDGGRLGFRITQAASANLMFDVYQSVDRSSTVKFSKDLRNLAAYSYSASSPTTNYIICGGGGEGTARTFYESGDNDSIVDFGRIETFQDRRDTTSSAELAQEVTSSLSEKGSQVGLSITPIDTTDLGYLNPYQVGDTISVVVDGEIITDTVREVKLTVDRSGEVISPVIGTPQASTILGFFRQLKDLTGRLTLQERR